MTIRNLGHPTAVWFRGAGAEVRARKGAWERGRVVRFPDASSPSLLLVVVVAVGHPAVATVADDILRHCNSTQAVLSYVVCHIIILSY